MSNYVENTFDENQDKHMVLETMLITDEQTTCRQELSFLAARLRGKLILPGDPDYEAARGVWNGTYNCHPALIVRCAGVEDVREAVTFAREQGMTLSVRSRGHSVVGYGTNEGGMVIDLSDMKSIAIDPQRCTA